MLQVDDRGGLPDPRRYRQDGRHPLLAIAAGEGGEAQRALQAALRELLLAGRDGEVRDALGQVPDRATYARLWEALCAASEGAGALPDEVAASVFALPVVLVAGARDRTVLPGTLADPAELARVLEGTGALGATRNFGLANALASLESIEALQPSTVLAWREPAAAAQGPRAVAPTPVAVRPGEETHLRFLLGAAITPAAAPALAETAAHMGSWGMPFSRALGRQLATPGVELLALPRAPAGILRAAYLGRRAQLEVALNLFLSNALRRMRLAAGEPTLVISSHEAAGGGAEMRASMSALLDDTLLHGFRWPLHPLEDPAEVAASVRQFAADCRMNDVRVVATVLPECVDSDGRLFLRAGDFGSRLPRH